MTVLFPFGVHDGHQLTLLKAIVLENLGAKLEELFTVFLHVKTILGMKVHPEEDLEIG
jgi:hypothetical protein